MLRGIKNKLKKARKAKNGLLKKYYSTNSDYPKNTNTNSIGYKKGSSLRVNTVNKSSKSSKSSIKLLSKISKLYSKVNTYTLSNNKSTVSGMNLKLFTFLIKSKSIFSLKELITLKYIKSNYTNFYYNHVINGYNIKKWLSIRLKTKNFKYSTRNSISKNKNKEILNIKPILPSKKKVLVYRKCLNKDGLNKKFLDYKNVELLRNYIGRGGKILNRKTTGLSAKAQRLVSKTIKRARIMGILPFINYT